MLSSFSQRFIEMRRDLKRRPVGHSVGKNLGGGRYIRTDAQWGRRDEMVIAVYIRVSTSGQNSAGQKRDILQRLGGICKL